VAASFAQLAGSTVTVQLAITFTSAFVGQKNVYAFGPGTGWLLGASYAPVGAFTVTAPPAGAGPDCGVNGNERMNVGDVQTIVNEALGLTQALHDLDGNGIVNVVDALMGIDSALGLSCAAQ
jgi:hypothetical protein